MPKKLKPMPIVHKSGEVERHNAYHRINPKGDEEFVIKRKGKDEETLNELSDSVMGLLENIEFSQPPAMSPEQAISDRTFNQAPELTSLRGGQVRSNDDTITNMSGSTPLYSDSPESGKIKSRLRASSVGNRSRNKYITGSYGDGIDYGATHSESFTGTAGIAISPTSYQVVGDEDDDDENKENEDNSTVGESIMNSRVLREWEPEFNAGEYDPGDYQMPRPSGNGVAKRKPKRDRLGSYDIDMTDAGEPFGAKHNQTAAMCDVDEDGVEGKPQGVHKSTHGEPTDGHQTELGHNWPDGPTNSGGGVAEPFDGTRWSDGGELHSTAPHSFSRSNRRAKLPGSGPIRGTSGAQMGEPMEWSPAKIGQLLGEDADVQSLFNNYVRANKEVYLEGFQALCDAHHTGFVIDEAAFLNLMDRNRDFMFHEHTDSNGSYWIPISEANDITGDMGAMYHDYTGARGDNSSDCPGCGYNGIEDECPECGHMMHGDMSGDGDPDPDMIDDNMSDNDDMFDDDMSDERWMKRRSMSDDDMSDDDMSDDDMSDMPGGDPDPDMVGENMVGVADDDMDEDFGESDFADPRYERSLASGSRSMDESLSRFMTSARSILENGGSIGNSEIADALNGSWEYYAGNINPKRAPRNVQETLIKMMDNFPGFNPLLEAGKDVMYAGSGKGLLGNRPKQSPDLGTQPGPDEFEQHGNIDNLLRRSQKNTYTTTPIMKGTEKGLTGTGRVKTEGYSNGAILRDNVNKLTKKIRNSIRESAKRLRGKHTVDFSIVVSENGSKTRTPVRSRLVEAVADLEEILQAHHNDDVSLQATFKNSGGQVVLRNRVPFATINPRGPIMSEGRAIFRFKRNAEAFANHLMAEGKACKVHSHNWGSAVSANGLSRVMIENFYYDNQDRRELPPARRTDFGSISKSAQKRQLRNMYTTKIVDDGELKIIRINKTDDTDGAADILSHFSRGTKWSTVDTKFGEMYLRQGPFYFIQRGQGPGARKYLYHPATNTMRDQDDMAVSDDENADLAEYIPELNS